MAGFSLVPGGHGSNYTGMLTRSIVFSATLVVFLATTALTLAAIIVPNWISRDIYTKHGSHIQQSYGLHRRCSNDPSAPYTADLATNLHCEEFPRYSDCHGGNRYFCSMWRTVGFLMSFGVVLEGMTIAAFLILIAGGKQKREQGWRVMAALAVVAGIVQAIGMALIAFLFENDDRFLLGWVLDKSWVMTTISWILQIACATAITLAALYLPSEGGYELIPDRVEDDA